MKAAERSQVDVETIKMLAGPNNSVAAGSMSRGLGFESWANDLALRSDSPKQPGVPSGPLSVKKKHPAVATLPFYVHDNIFGCRHPSLFVTKYEF